MAGGASAVPRSSRRRPRRRVPPNVPTTHIPRFRTPWTSVSVHPTPPPQARPSPRPHHAHPEIPPALDLRVRTPHTAAAGASLRGSPIYHGLPAGCAVSACWSDLSLELPAPARPDRRDTSPPRRLCCCGQTQRSEAPLSTPLNGTIHSHTLFTPPIHPLIRATHLHHVSTPPIHTTHPPTYSLRPLPQLPSHSHHSPSTHSLQLLPQLPSHLHHPPSTHSLRLLPQLPSPLPTFVRAQPPALRRLRLASPSLYATQSLLSLI